ncbi:hypothetical protein CC2G_002476 [Coprinopsis cinerea AmutBmut pab1-1]|nr:hypothetical protein CC2G_002476 [Coprinopsis cinerea AmutBmut pab1-1]
MTPVEARAPSLDLIIGLLATKETTHRPGHVDILSRVILTDHKQVSAVTASVEPPLPRSANLRTTLYISLIPGPGRELPTHEQIETRIRSIVKDLQGLTDEVVQGASNSAMQLPDRVNEADFMTAFYRHGWKRFSHYYHERSERIPQAVSLLEEFQRSSQMKPGHFQHIEDTLAWLEWLDHMIQLGSNKGATHAAEFVGEEYINGLKDWSIEEMTRPALFSWLTSHSRRTWNVGDFFDQMVTGQSY